MNRPGPRRKLIVYLKDGEERTAEIPYWDVERLEAQLAAFARQRDRKTSRRYGQLYEFSNRHGESLAFAEEHYVRHEVVDLDARRTDGAS